MSDPVPGPLNGLVRERIDEARALGWGEEDDLLLVLAESQQMVHVRHRMPRQVYVISTASNGLGEHRDSGRTPRGWHRIAARIGDRLPAGSILADRRFTGNVLPEKDWRSDDPGSDRILTRILRLEGMEPGRNRGDEVDTWTRLIYLHGTNHEQDLGTPASHGCIRMANRDILELFEAIRDRETWVWIG